MKTSIKFLAAMIFVAALLIGGCARKKSTGWKSIQNPEAAAQLKSFVAEKEAQAKADGSDSPPEFKAYFAAAEKGDWLAVSNTFNDFSKHAPQYQHSGTNDGRLRGVKWAAVVEIWGALYAFNVSDEKYSAAFGNDIIKSIPPGSIYFGGTDPGRFVITAMQKSHVDGDPFFTLTQNALADGTYLDYLRSIYGDKIKIPTQEDLQKCFRDYTEDAQRRMQNHQLKPGENVHVDGNGRVQVSGQVAVMEINGLLAKTIFDKNPDREFFIEESFPLDWMYPYLEPHGLIFKINRQPLPELSDEIVQRDHDYWSKCVTPMIGGWLNDDTTVEEAAAFSKKVFVRRDFNGFKGDRLFIQNASSREMFSYLRSNIADVYVWRMNHATTSDEKDRMAHEADFAFRQALALCPYMSGTVSSYVDLLKGQNRIADAILVAETAAQFPASQNSDPRS
ncbi:MAG TPA: hypothetical protein VIK62_01450, partial [Verrucomicrobiae bacterium]